MAIHTILSILAAHPLITVAACVIVPTSIHVIRWTIWAIGTPTKNTSQLTGAEFDCQYLAALELQARTTKGGK